MPSDNSRDRMAQLLAQLLSSSAETHERETARRQLGEELARQGQTLDDLYLHLQPDPPETDDDAAPAPVAEIETLKLLDSIHERVQPHVALKPHEYVAMALWVAHTFVYEHFLITPRLGFLSPVPGCGKTTAMSLLAHLVNNPKKSDSVTPAALYHTIDRHRPLVLLVDEADNLDLFKKGPLKAVFNSGHRHDGSIDRFDPRTGETRSFVTFAPLAFAAIDTLPLTILERSILIHMTRHDRTRLLELFDPHDARTQAWLTAVRRGLVAWARTVKLKTVKLDRDPAMPRDLHNRVADNWRPLISIADSLGWGAAARDAALAFNREVRDEDAGVVLLRDIRDIFDRHAADRLASVTLVANLIGLEDSLWSSWRGGRLSQTVLARLLRPFQIQPQSVWPAQRVATSKSRKGYYRTQFAQAWRSYCAEDGTPAPRDPNNYLPGESGDD